MARLFISLYLFIAVVFVGVSAVLDQVLDEAGSGTPTAVKLGATLLEASTLPPKNAIRVARQAGLSARELSINDINWLPQDLQTLGAGGVITLFDPQKGYQFYLQVEPQTLVELSDPLHHPAPPFVLYSGLFFLLLGILLAVWVWPLWCDLHRLQKAADSTTIDAVMPEVAVGRTSLIKPIADALNAMSQRVSALMQTQRELTGAVAHEFRTPLARLKFALAIKPTPDSSPWHAMNDDVDELETLVQEMLSYTSMESQQPELNMSSIPVSDLCQAVVDKLPEDHKARLSIKVAKSNIHVLADAHFIDRAVQNLLINACRYARSQVDVHVKRHTGGVEIVVADDGPGVESAMQEKIFEPFFRPDEGRDRRRGGAGLGLAIVRRIMHWHDGQCWAGTRLQGGARFVLRFPREVLAP